MSEFQALVQLLDEFVVYEDAKDRRSGVVASYEITEFWISFSDVLVATHVKTLTEIMASKTCTIRHLNFSDALSMLTAGECLFAFEKLVRVSVCSMGENRPTLETLELFNAPFDTEHVASICSALRYPNPPKKLQLEWESPDPGDEDIALLIWAYFAFAVFHPDSEAQLDRLNLAGPPLRPEIVTAFASIFRLPHPARLLWLLENGAVPQGVARKEVPLPAGCRLFVRLEASMRV